GIRYRNVTGVQTCALPIYEIPVLTTDSERICLTRIDCSAEQFCNMYILAVRGFVDRCDFKPGTPALDGPLVCDLSAAHSVERRPDRKSVVSGASGERR